MNETARMKELAGILTEGNWDYNSNLGKLASKAGAKSQLSVKFEVTSSFDAWVEAGVDATNSYYGNAKISRMSWKKEKLNPGDVIVGTAHGIFLYPGGNQSNKKIIRCGSKNPADVGTFEKSSYFSNFPENKLKYLGE